MYQDKINRNSNVNFKDLVQLNDAAALHSHLDGLQHSLSDFISLTENKFSGFSLELQSLYYSAKNISTLSENASVTISGEEVQNSITSIDSMLNSISMYLGNSDSRIDDGKKNLDLVHAVMETICEDLTGFKRIVKHLRILGMSTRIENARLNMENSGFQVLAENVEKLSSVINDKTLSIRNNASGAIKLIEDVNRKISALQAEQQHLELKILKSTSESLRFLQDKYQQSHQKATIIEQFSRDIYQSVGKIITSVQFHDITRQQTEHVIDAISEMVKHINEGDTDDPSVKNTLAGISHLQSAQLLHTYEELTDAVRNIIRNMGDVKTLIDNIEQSTEELLSTSENDDNSFLKMIENGLASAAEALKQNSTIKDEYTESIKTVNQTVENLIALIIQIDEIGSEIALIALNARIKAVHTGSDGVALDVLAEEIQNLSRSAKSQTSLIIESIKHISEASEALKSNAGYNYDDGNTSLEKLNDGIISILGTLSEIENKSLCEVKQIRQETVALLDKITQSSTALVELDTEDSPLKAAAEGLNELSICMGYSGENESSGHIPISELQRNYTMQSEREIHARLSGFGRTGTESDSIAGISSSHSSAAAGNPDNDDLGDNVELF